MERINTNKLIKTEKVTAFASHFTLVNNFCVNE